jgi:hypothetical protein
MKANLIEINIGQWAYDDLVIYMSEICKELENIEINSDQVTDASILQILKKCKYLRFLDVSGCDKFNGLAFTEAIQPVEG